MTYIHFATSPKCEYDSFDECQVNKERDQAKKKWVDPATIDITE